MRIAKYMEYIEDSRRGSQVEVQIARIYRILERGTCHFHKNEFILRLHNSFDRCLSSSIEFEFESLSFLPQR